MPPSLRSLVIGITLAAAACGGPDTTQPPVLRLVDLFPEADVVGTAGQSDLPPPTRWSTDDGNLEQWSAGTGVSGLAVRDGALTGSSTSPTPIVHVERERGESETDVLHEVIVRARVSEGTNLWVTFAGGDDPGVERAAERAEDFPWPLSSPLVAGEEPQTYTIRAAAAARASFPASGIRHILLRPTDVSGADFAIESVQLVFRREHLAGIPAGVSWQGLSEVYRETIVTRAPEEVRFNVAVPDRPLLDLAVGTLEEGPVTFRVHAGENTILEKTVTTPNRWEEAPLALDALAGNEVVLSLSLEAERPGAIGFWGAPAIRRRGELGPGRPKGVVLILLDTLRRDHLDAYGYERETAPAIRRLASEGTLFADAIAQGAWTKVSVPSMLSSTYPSSNGIYEFFHKLPASADTVAEAFRAAGYATWAAAGNGFSGRSTNLHQGLEVLHERGSLEIPDGQSSAKSARLLADRLLPWLDTHHEVPFFVFYHALDPHSPYEPYRPYDTWWGAADGKKLHEERVEKVRPFIKSGFMKPMGLPLRSELVEAGVDPNTFVEHEIDWYDGSIRGADVEIQRILEKLDGLGLTDDTLVVFFSDHGEEFLDHGGHFHEENVYGEMVNVPLVMRWPGVVPAGRVVEETVQMLDVVPTVLDLVGIELPENMQGESFRALLENPDRFAPRPAISEWERRTDQRDQEMVDARSIILDGYKLIHNVRRPEGFPEYELYDHGNDPLDQNDIAAEHPEIVERLAAALAEWQKWALANQLPTDTEAIEGLDAEELERLRSLGYVQ